jgi:hypothetical protein
MLPGTPMLIGEAPGADECRACARWFHQYIWDRERSSWRSHVQRVVFWHKRLTFEPHGTNAMWPTLVVEFGNTREERRGKFPAHHC